MDWSKIKRASVRGWHIDRDNFYKRKRKENDKAITCSGFGLTTADNIYVRTPWYAVLYDAGYNPRTYQSLQRWWKP